MKKVGNINDKKGGPKKPPTKPKKTRTKKYLWQLSEDKKPKERVIGVFGDVHLPYVVDGYLDFLIETFEKFGVTDIICSGDLVDNYAHSRFDIKKEAESATDEYQRAYDMVQEFIEVFPVVKMAIGNHDTRIGKNANVLDVFLKSFEEAWGLPDTWEVEDHFIIDGVLYIHNGGKGGKDGAFNSALENRMSTVSGHYHTTPGCKPHGNHTDVIFGMNAGSGIDAKTWAAAYNHRNAKQPITACGIVYDKQNAFVYTMKKEGQR